MFNQVTLVGNLTRDVDIRYSQAGSAIGNVGIATSRKWKTQSGEQKDEVMFIDLTLFARTAEIANNYCRKGSKVLITGRIKLEQWDAQDGSKRSKHVVVVESLQMLDSKQDSQNPNQGQQPQQNQNNYGGQQAQSNQGGYSQPQQQQGYGQPQAQPSYNAPTQQRQQQGNAPQVPEIDDDEIS